MTSSTLRLDRLSRTEQSGMKLGLDRFRLMLADLGHPEREVPAILVGGTNGKGSVAAMLARMLEHAGYTTGLFTSPHLLSYRERVRVGGQAIAAAEVGRLLERLGPTLEARGGSFFEAMTALAFLHFQRRRVDCGVLEVGLGGRLDATNLAHPIASTVVTIGMDHTHILGRTVEAIAREKVEIARRGRPFIVGPGGRAGAILEREARQRGARPVRLGQDARFRTLAADRSGSTIRFECDEQKLPAVRLSLPGRHQARNAAIALLTAATLRRTGFDLPLPGEALAEVSWPGRLDWVEGTPAVLLDGAHNPPGSRALARHLQEFFAGERIVGVVGLLGRRSPATYLKPLLPLVQQWVMTQPPGERALPAAHLAAVVPGAEVEVEVAAALERASALAGSDGIVLVSGSLRVVAAAYRALGRRRFDRSEVAPAR